jgi:hypothetical protein
MVSTLRRSIQTESLTVQGFEHLRIATSGMAHDVLHVSKVVKLAGKKSIKRPLMISN